MPTYCYGETRDPQPGKTYTKVEATFDSTAYGDLAGACDRLLAFNHAGGRVLPGLTVRRGAERALCLEGVAEGVAK